jgi:hypothetical protein
MYRYATTLALSCACWLRSQALFVWMRTRLPQLEEFAPMKLTPSGGLILRAMMVYSERLMLGHRLDRSHRLSTRP